MWRIGWGDYNPFQSHGRRVGCDQARGHGLKVVNLEENHPLQDVVLSIHHATMLTFSSTPATKITWAELGLDLP